MKKFSSSLLILALSIPLLTGCNPSNEATQKNQGIQEKKPAQSNSKVTQPAQDNISGTQPAQDARLILPGAMDEKMINLENVTAIELYDLDGKKLDEKFTAEETANIVKAYNDSMIDDTSYIEMITGKKMVIVLKGGKTINITSYGAEDRVVAAGDNFNYHLISAELAKILLAK